MGLETELSIRETAQQLTGVQRTSKAQRTVEKAVVKVQPVNPVPRAEKGNNKGLPNAKFLPSRQGEGSWGKVWGRQNATMQ